MEGCYDCRHGPDLHKEMATDMQILACGIKSLEQNHLENAKEELGRLSVRMTNRFNKAMGRLL